MEGALNMPTYAEQFALNEKAWNWSTEEAEAAWYMLNKIRYFEETSVKYYKKGLVGGSVHTSIGQEAIAVGMLKHLNNDDYMTMTYRGRGQALAKGADPYKLYAEMFGRVDGYCKGKGGPMHIASNELGILGANGIVAGGIPIAVGGAITAKKRKKGQVAITFFGDGATNQGVFHEAVNLAAIMHLPMIFVCENNLYSEMTPIEDSVLIEHLADRGMAYGIPSVIVDGNDVRAVSEVAKIAVERARNGEGPTFIEAKTYRQQGHMYGDAETYRTKEEVEKWKAKDPLDTFRNICLQNSILTEQKLDDIQAEVKVLIEESAKKATEADEPSLEEVFTDVY